MYVISRLCSLWKNLLGKSCISLLDVRFRQEGIWVLIEMLVSSVSMTSNHMEGDLHMRKLM